MGKESVWGMMSVVVHYEKRHYPYDLELDTKYREYTTANNLQKTPLNYKEQEPLQKPLDTQKPKGSLKYRHTEISFNFALFLSIIKLLLCTEHIRD